MENQALSPRLRKPKILELVQCLYQQGEIDVRQKNSITQLLKEEQYEKLQSVFRSMTFGTTMPDVIMECISLTQ